MIGYELHPEARADLDKIWEYIAADSVDAAVRMIGEFLQRFKDLVAFPHQGHRRPDLTNRSLRFVRVRDYLVAYAPDKRPVWILAVMHGHRSPRVMAAILRGREE